MICSLVEQAFGGQLRRGGGGGGSQTLQTPAADFFVILLPAQVIFLVIFYRARVLEISPFSLAKTVAFYAIADHATLDVCLLVWVKLFSFFIFSV